MHSLKPNAVSKNGLREVFEIRRHRIWTSSFSDFEDVGFFGAMRGAFAGRGRFLFSQYRQCIGENDVGNRILLSCVWMNPRIIST